MSAAEAESLDPLAGALVKEILTSSVGRAKKFDSAADAEETEVLTSTLIKKKISNLGPSADGVSLVFRSLDLQELNLGDVSLLSEYPHIQHLNLRGNSIADLSSISSMTHLLSLDASNNLLAEALSVSPAPRFLKSLNVSNNKILSLSLTDFTHLTTLNLDQNILTRLDGLEQCKNLVELRASSNYIEDLPSFATIPLKRLYLANNRLSSLSFLDTLGQLEHLDLSGNMISTLEGMEHLERLVVLHLAANKIADVAVLDPLQLLLDLCELSLGGNPLKNYRPHVLFSMPRLVTLDGSTVSCIEKVAAVNQCAPPPAVVAALDHATVVAATLNSPVSLAPSVLTDSDLPYPIAVLASGSPSAAARLAHELVTRFPAVFVPWGAVALPEDDLAPTIAESRILCTFRAGAGVQGLSQADLEQIALRFRIPVAVLPLMGVHAIRKTHVAISVWGIRASDAPDVSDQDQALFKSMLAEDEFDGHLEITGETDYAAFADRLAQSHTGALNELKAKYSH
eukprot:m.237651 g.237651  ORF g.237651 m.237651 type:complete len:512 (+) comp21264_c0_seq1:30-1565(+)